MNSSNKRNAPGASNPHQDKTVVFRPGQRLGADDEMGASDEKTVLHSMNPLDEAFDARTIVQPLSRDVSPPPPPQREVPGAVRPPPPPVADAQPRTPPPPPPSPERFMKPAGEEIEEITSSWPLSQVSALPSGIPPAPPTELALDAHHETPHAKEEAPVETVAFGARLHAKWASLPPKTQSALMGLAAVVLLPVIFMIFSGPGESASQSEEASVEETVNAAEEATSADPLAEPSATRVEQGAPVAPKPPAAQPGTDSVLSEFDQAFARTQQQAASAKR